MRSSASSRRSGRASRRITGGPRTSNGRSPRTKLWLVQSRDITTLYPLPANAPDPDRDLRVYFSANVAQGVLGPFTPMGLQTFRLIGSAFAKVFGMPVDDPAAGPPLTVEAAMRLYIDLTPVLRDPFGRELPGRVMGAMEF